MKKSVFTASIAFCAILFFSGCGGGGGGEGQSTSSGSSTTGSIVDAPIRGLSYNCQTSGIQGTTNSKGEFRFKPGDICTFKIGNFPIGTIDTSNLDDVVITPKDLLEAKDFNDKKVINFAALMWTLDKDGDPENGIDINASKLADVDLDDLKVADPEEIFEDLNKTKSLLAEDQDNLENLAKNKKDEIVEHIKKSEIKALKIYDPNKAANRIEKLNINAVSINYENFNNKTFDIVDGDDVIKINFYDNGTYHETGNEDEWLGDGFWTIDNNNTLVMIEATQEGDDIYPTVLTAVFEDINDTSAKIVAFTDEDVKKLDANITENSGSVGNEISNRVEIDKEMLNNKVFEINENSAITFYADGTFKNVGEDEEGSWYITGSWTIINNFVVMIAEDDEEIVAYVIAVKSLNENSIDVIVLDEDGIETIENITVSDAKDPKEELNYTKQSVGFDDIANKKFEFNDNGSRFVFEFYKDGTYVERGNDNEGSWTIEGSWNIVDGSVILTGYEYGSDYVSIVVVDFASLGKNSAEVIAYTDDGVHHIQTSISNLEE